MILAIGMSWLLRRRRETGVRLSEYINKVIHTIVLEKGIPSRRQLFFYPIVTCSNLRSPWIFFTFTRLSADGSEILTPRLCHPVDELLAKSHLSADH